MPSATLNINLSALAANYNLLKERHSKNNVAAVVKADAYGLGVREISLRLQKEGCEDFFVATLDEAIELRNILPLANIGVFQGILAGEKEEYIKHNLIPVLNILSQLNDFIWIIENNQNIKPIIHIDTGMTRLGLSQSDLSYPALQTFREESSVTIMSHLACADNPEHPKNNEQLQRFKQAVGFFNNTKTSLANSAGIFLDKEFHFDMARVGCALYGISPSVGGNPMRHVATLTAPILQIRELDRDESIGYGATVSLAKGKKIAIAALGYADGYFRNLGNKGTVHIAGHKAPVIGRVSMDMVAIDLSEVPISMINYDSVVEFINENYSVNDLAADSGTIGYEVFTHIGNRVKRVYY
ncbi:MAG: alanine racemase [Rickettsiales bacterium]